jgi:Tfp pilus assembly protein PilP
MSCPFDPGRGHNPAAAFNHQLRITMDQAQLILAAANIAGGMAAVHYGKFSGLEPKRITEIAETAVRIAKAIEIEVAKNP